MPIHRSTATLIALAAVGGAALVAGLPVTAQQDAEFAAEMMCQICHKSPQAEGRVPAVTEIYMETKHAKAEGEGPRYADPDEDPGVGCQACHGPGQGHVLGHGDPELIWMPEDIEEREGRLSLCGRCHAAYEEEWVEDYAYGDNILDDITLLEATGEKLEQVNEMKGSLHFTDPTAPTCVSCHSGHMEPSPDLPSQIRKPVNELCLECHAAQEDYAHSGWAEVPAEATCSTCHLPEGKHVFIAPASAAGLPAVGGAGAGG